MKIGEIKALLESLDAERAALDALQSKLSACNLSGHQHIITLNVSGLGSVELIYQDRSTGWASKLIRGREMIMLGVKKALAAKVSEQKQVVDRLVEAIHAARIDI